MLLYYTLIPTRLVVVDDPAPEPADGQLPAYTSPRAVAVQETVGDLWEYHDEIDSVLDGRISLVGVSPLGEIHSGRLDESGPEMVCDDGWRVESILSLDQLLGPEAVRIRQIVATPLGVNQESDYADVVEDIRGLDEEIDDLVESAQDALNLAGLDGDWWASQVGCTRGYELIALAATDLVAESSAWDMRAWHQLLRPWAKSVRWPVAG